MEDVKLGPSGGDGGLPIEGYVIPSGARISEIEVTSGWYIDSIRVIYTDAEGAIHALPGFGGNGSYAHRFTLEPGEYLIGVSGRSGRYVDSIAFHTNLRVSPTYGGDSGEVSFSFLAPEDSEVVGFFGRADWYVDAIGIVTRPRPDATAASVPEAPVAKPRKTAKKAAAVPVETAEAAPKTRKGRKAAQQPATAAPAVTEAAPTAEKPAKKSKKRAAAASAPSVSESTRAVEVAAPVTPDNLELIEGIGPKIAELLAQHGITTFAGLAAASAEQLRSLLLAAGRRFAVSDPTTWPAQAALAAQGDMDGLKAMQAELKGGRKAKY